MDRKGKINHVFKLLGILLIILAYTAFAQAQTFNLTCDDPLSCSVKSYCSDSGILALQQAWNSSSYSVTSSSTGEHTCNATVRVTAFGKGGDSHHQDNEVTDVILNGVKIGTTRDNYANPGDPLDYTFCGWETQTLGTATVNLSTNNTVTLATDDSHGIVSVTINCTPTGRPSCEEQASPRFDSIEDEEIHYDDNYEIDLWTVVNDYDAKLSDLNLEVSVSGNSLNCNIEENRYLVCETKGTLGESTVTVSAIDECEKEDEETFKINVINNPPVININDMTKSCVSDLDKFIDLRDYSVDEEEDLADYNIEVETNTSLLDCEIEDDYYLSCNVNTCEEDSTELTISITDIYNEVDDTTFKINLENFKPEVEDLPNTCVNEDDDEVIDLRDYFDDLEDGTNLDYFVDQNTYKHVECSIDNDYFLSCELKTNQFVSTLLTITAEDSEGEEIDANMLLKANCDADPNGRNKISFNAPQIGICLEKCTSYTTFIEVTNNTDEKKYFDLDLDYDDHFEIELGKNKFYLNEGQSTKVPVSARTCSNDADNYDVVISDYDNDLEITLEYEVGNCENYDGFEIEEYENKVCQGEVARYTVDVTNSTEEEKVIYLTAENQFLLPYFEKERVILEDDEKESVDVIVNAKHAPIGKYNVFLGGDADNYHIEKRLVVEVVDCSDISERNVLIETAGLCIDTERGATVESSFTLRRLADGCEGCKFDELGVDLSLFDLDYELSHDTVYLEAGEEKVIDYTLYVPENISTGVHLVEINAKELPQGVFDEELGFIDSKTICINVAGINESSVKVLTNTKDIAWCGSEIFELEIINSGDFDETFDLSATDLPVGVQVIFSEEEVTVPAKSTKIIYVSVATDHDSEIKDNQSVKINLEGTTDLSTRIYFNIKGKAELADIEILSATELLTLNAGESGTYEVLIRNNSDRTYNNIELSIESSDAEIISEVRLIESIAPGEIKTITGDISALDANGYIKAAFELESTSFLNKKEFGIFVKNNKPLLAGINSGEMGNINGPATGFFSLGGVSLGVGLGIFFILLLLALVLAVIFTKEPKTKEIWTEG